MNSKFFLFILLIFFLAFSLSVSAKKLRDLEIEYPQIPDWPIIKTIGTPLPDYIVYIFRFVIAITGFIIFGVFIYNGFLYLTSAGRPAQLSEAKTGLISALIGGVILLCGALLFKTINFQLIKIEPPNPLLVKTVIPSGIWICRGKVDGESIISKYTSPKLEETNKAGQELQKAIKKNDCRRISGSQEVLMGGGLTGGDLYTIFTIPEKNPKGGWEYRWALILKEREEEDDLGRCKILPEGEEIYKKFSLQYKTEFPLHSIIILEKPEREPLGPVTIYSGWNYNEPPQPEIPPAETKEKVTTPKTLSKMSFGTAGNDLKKIEEKELGELYHNTRSIEVPESYIAVMKSVKGNLKCAVMTQNNPNLIARPIGKCRHPAGGLIHGRAYYPCLETLYVIKAVIKR